MTASRVNAIVEPLCRQWQQRRDIDEAAWPAALWESLVRAGGCGWGIRHDVGGEEWSAPEILQAAIELTRGDLTAAFVWTQFLAAVQRLDKAPPALREKWLPRCARGEAFATVGISHLTTSRSLGPGPAVRGEMDTGGIRLTGSIPWVTGLTHAQVIVAGATVADDRQVLVALNTSLPGVELGDPLSLLAVRGSMTGRVHLREVFVSQDDIIAGPVENVLKAIGSDGAGSLMTSAVAAGHALGSLDQIDRISDRHRDWNELRAGWSDALQTLRSDLITAAGDEHLSQARVEDFRLRATTAALQMSQTLLTLSKGAGFVSGHPAERFAREAMFFLVWSCPLTVAGELLYHFALPARSASNGFCESPGLSG